MCRKSYKPSFRLCNLTPKQRNMWNEIFLNGIFELLTQRDRRTAFILQSKFGAERIKIETSKSNDEIEHVFFTYDFAKEVGANIRPFHHTI